MKRSVFSALLSGVTILTLGATSAMAAVTAPVAVPEPGTLALLAGGIGAVAWAKLRSRK